MVWERYFVRLQFALFARRKARLCAVSGINHEADENKRDSFASQYHLEISGSCALPGPACAKATFMMSPSRGKARTIRAARDPPRRKWNRTAARKSAAVCAPQVLLRGQCRSGYGSGTGHDFSENDLEHIAKNVGSDDRLDELRGTIAQDFPTECSQTHRHYRSPHFPGRRRR